MAIKRTTPDLSNSTALITGKWEKSIDLDLAFMPKPGSPLQDVYKGGDPLRGSQYQGDVYKKYDAAAVIQSVRNILLTNHNEKPFAPKFGGNIRSMLFETKESYSEPFIRREIAEVVSKYEKRAILTEIIFHDEDGFQISRNKGTLVEWNRNAISITVKFRIETDGDIYTATVNMNRLR